MVTYKGLPAPLVCDFLTREASRERYAPGTKFHIWSVELCANTGAYVDSTFHRYADGADMAALPLDWLADLDAVVVDSRERTPTLLAAGIPICEHLNLDALPAAGFRFSAVPVKLRGLGTFPVRSYAVL